MLKSIRPSIFRWFKWFNGQFLFKNSQWISCYHWISLLLHDSWHGCPSKLRLNKKNLCVIPSYYSVSSWQQGRVIVGKLIGFAGLSALLNSHCGSVGTVITHQLDCGVSAAVSGGKSPQPANIIQPMNLSPLHYAITTTCKIWFISFHLCG